MNGKRIAVRGSLWLKELTCKIPAASDPVAACQELRRSHLAAIYIGNVAVRLSAPCKCDVKGGRFCPVSDPGQRAVVTGAYRYDAEPREEGAQEDAAPRHLLHDAKICVD